MKKLKRLNRLLIVLALLLGLSLGAAATLLSLSIGGNLPCLSFAGLICVLLNAILALLLPLFVHFRDTLIHDLDAMNERFGGEVNFLDEEKFMKALRKENSKAELYALHLHVGKHQSELELLSTHYALCKALDEEFKDALVGFTSRGDFLFAKIPSDEDFKARFVKVDNHIKAEPDVVPYFLLLGRSKDAPSLEEAANQALSATLMEEYSRENLSFLIYEEEKPALAPINLKQEEEQGRLTYSLLPFGEDEQRIVVLTPSLYDPYRGDMSDKDLSRALELSASRLDFDETVIKRAVNVLKTTEEKLLIVYLGKEAAESGDYLLRIARAFEANSLDLSRLGLALYYPSLHHQDAKMFLHKAKGLGIKVGAYEFAGEHFEDFLKAELDFIFMKPELLRKNASVSVINKMIDVLNALNIPVYIEQGKLGEERSSLPSFPLQRLPREEEEA